MRFSGSMTDDDYTPHQQKITACCCMAQVIRVLQSAEQVPDPPANDADRFREGERGKPTQENKGDSVIHMGHGQSHQGRRQRRELTWKCILQEWSQAWFSGFKFIVRHARVPFENAARTHYRVHRDVVPACGWTCLPAIRHYRVSLGWRGASLSHAPMVSAQGLAMCSPRFRWLLRSDI